MPFQSRRQQRWAFATGQPFAKRWAKATPDFAALPEQKDAGAEAGAMLHGPGGLMATPGLRKWGRRRPRVTTKPMTRSEAARVAALARWGKYTPRPDAPVVRGIALSKQPKPTHQAAPKPPSAARRARGGKKGGAGAKPKKTDQQRQQEQEAKRTQREQERQAQHDAKRQQVYAKLNIAPDGQTALEALRNGEQPDTAALARGGFVAAGLVEQASDGSYRMTPAGRALMAAVEGGDAGRAADVVSAARDRLGARQARQAAAETRKREVAARRAALASRRGGGGKKKPKPAPGLSAAAQRGIDRTRQHLADAFARARRQTTKAQTAEDRAMFAKMGGGGSGGGSKLWPKGPSGKRTPQAAAAQSSNAEPKPTTTDDIKQRDADLRKARAQDEDKLQAALARGDYTRADAIQSRIDQHNRDLKDLEHTKVINPPAGQTARQHEERQRAEYARQAASADREAREAGHKLSDAEEEHRTGGTITLGEGPRIGDLRRDYETKKRRASELRDLAREKNFAVFKSADGAYRWLARTTTAYRDRDHEIITTKALETDAARMTATGQYGPLRYWHIGQPDPFDPAAPWGAGLDIGDCDYSTVIGRTSIESGTFKSTAIGRAFAESADDYELSPGFFHPPDQPNAAGEYDTIRRFERSVVPVRYGRASNLFTGMTVKEHRMDQATYEARVKAFMADMNAKGVPPEVAAQSLASMEQADKSATAQGIAYKSDDAPLVYYLGDGTPGLLQDGRFVALKAAPAVEAEKAPMMADAETPDETMAEPGEEPGDGPAQYIGDMTPAEFWAQLQQYLAPVLKMQDMVKAIGDHASELKTMYGGAATKDAGTIARIAQLETELATLKGDQPAVVESEALAALKSKGPQSPPDPNTPQIPDDPSRPLAGLGAQLLPQLYGAAVPQVQGFAGANGWQFGQPPQNTGGN